MKLALVSQQYPPQSGTGGIGTQTFAKAHGLVARGHEVHVIAHSLDARLQRYVDGGVNVTRIPGPQHRMAVETEVAWWVAYSSEVAVALAELGSRVDLDVIEFPEFGCEGFVHLLNRSSGSPATVIQLHGPLVMMAHAIGWPGVDTDFYRVASALEGATLRLVDAVYSSSRCSIEWCARYHALDPDSVPVLHMGVDTTLFRPRPEEAPSRPTIVFAGRMAENKGVRSLIRAGVRLRADYPDLRLRLIGSGPEGMLRSLAKEAALAAGGDLIDWVGFLPAARLAGELVRGHVFAAPSIYEGGPGLVYLEAMACGLPVVACTGSGSSESIVPDETGILIPPGDEDALVAALSRLLEDEPLRRQMGQRGREHVMQTAASEDRLDAIEAFLASVVTRKAKPPR